MKQSGWYIVNDVRIRDNLFPFFQELKIERRSTSSRWFFDDSMEDNATQWDRVFFFFFTNILWFGWYISMHVHKTYVQDVALINRRDICNCNNLTKKEMMLSEELIGVKKKIVIVLFYRIFFFYNTFKIERN